MEFVWINLYEQIYQVIYNSSPTIIVVPLYIAQPGATKKGRTNCGIRQYVTTNMVPTQEAILKEDRCKKSKSQFCIKGVFQNMFRFLHTTLNIIICLFRSAHLSDSKNS